MSGGPAATIGVEIAPPARLAVGRGTAFSIAGYAYVPGRRTRALAVVLGGTPQPVARFRLPRLDVLERLPASDPAGPSAYRSGFAAVVDVPPVGSAGRRELALRLTLDDGAVQVPVGSVDLESGTRPPEDAARAAFGGSGPPVAICMATYEPPAELLRRQLDSIREQTHSNWVCLISDDCSSEEAFEQLIALTKEDPRFVVSRSPERLGFYLNFERALSMAPPEAGFVTLCDQDDYWRPEKLGRLLDAIGTARLVYSDARIVTPDGDLVRPSYWTERRNNYTSFGSLLLANTVTGAASLFRRELLDDVLPFPPRIAKGFHDHWLAIVALALGEIAYVDERLYDYVQHGAAVIGHSEANRRPRPIRRHLMERLRNPTGGSRAVYYFDWHQQLLFCEVLRLRAWHRMEPAKRRTLRRLLSADSGVGGIAWLLGRRARRLWGHDETLDRELFYGHALLRRRAVSLWTAGRERPNRFLPRDEAVPTDSDRAA
jgi:glycosyltransferase involved in cell wall biosynthesis